MTIQVLYFHVLLDCTGRTGQSLELNGETTVALLLQQLVAIYPELEKHLPSLRVAVNEEFASPDHPLHSGDEVALLPPFGGG